MTQVATVEKILRDGYVQISVPRKSACGHYCEECAGCGMTGASGYAEARDPVGVRPGDKVVVESSTRAILAVTWLVYMLPVVFFLLGYFLSAGLTEGWRSAVAIAAEAVSFIHIKLYDGPSARASRRSATCGRRTATCRRRTSPGPRRLTAACAAVWAGDTAWRPG